MDDLLAAVVANPNDDAPRLVWADREGGLRGELVVVQCELAKMAPRADASRRRKLRDREGAIIAALAPERDAWRPKLEWLTHRGPRYERGFLIHDRCEIRELELAAEAKASPFEAHPLLRSLVIDGVSGHLSLSSDFAEAWEERKKRIGAAFAAFPPGRVETLALGGTIEQREDIDFTRSTPLGGMFLDILDQTATLASLKELTIDDCGVESPDRVRSLAKFEHLEHLRLDQPHERLGWGAAADIVNAQPSVRSFGMNGNWNWFGERERIGPFLARVAPKRLRGLELWTSSGANLVEDFDAHPDAVASLEHLCLVGQRYELGAIADCRALANLTDLELVGLEDATQLGVLARAAFAPKLRRLTVTRRDIMNPIDAATAAKLASMPALGQVVLSEPASVFDGVPLDVLIANPYVDRHVKE